MKVSSWNLNEIAYFVVLGMISSKSKRNLPAPDISNNFIQENRNNFHRLIHPSQLLIPIFFLFIILTHTCDISENVVVAAVMFKCSVQTMGNQGGGIPCIVSSLSYFLSNNTSKIRTIHQLNSVYAVYLPLI
jgi:hypothetical protein